MEDAADHEKRARELADTTRRFLIGLAALFIGCLAVTLA